MSARVTLDDFSRLTAAVYSAVTTPENWAAVLGDLRHTLDAKTCALIQTDETGRSVLAADLPAEVRADYEQYYHRIDYVLEAVEHSPLGVLRGGRSLVALQPESEFHLDWLRPQEMTDGLFVRLTDGPAPLLLLAAGPRPPKPFVPLFGALVPHLQQALRSQAHLGDLIRRTEYLGAVTQALRQAIIVVDAASHVVYANAAAEDVLRRADGFRMRNGRLEAVAASTDTALQLDIHAATAPTDAPPQGNSLVCTRPCDLRPYVAEVLPIEPLSDPGCARRAMVVIVDPDDESETPAALLRRHYGLTAGETDIALMMLRYGGVKDIAERLSLSQATVKTHLQHIYDKTGTHRQADLVRLLLGLRSPYRLAAAARTG